MTIDCLTHSLSDDDLLLLAELVEYVDSLAHQVAHDELVAPQDFTHSLLLRAAQTVSLALTHLLVVVQGHRVVAGNEALVGLHEFLESWLAAIHI